MTMATLGVNDLKQYALPSYWDAAELEKVRLADGTTYAGFINDVSQALAVQNAALLADPLLGTMMATTTELSVEYGIGVSNGFEEATEYGLPDAKRAATTGHMLSLKEYDRAFGWTWMFLNKARRMQLDEDIASGMADLRNLWSQKILTRFFKSTYDAVGSSGRSMPFCDGGTADSSYVPPPKPDRAAAFAYTHSHLLRMDGITQTNLEIAVKHLWEHGHDGPYELLVAQADLGSWRNTTNVTGYVSRPDPLIRYGVQTDLANVGDGIEGVIETAYGACRLRQNARIPTNYYGLYKSYGPRDQRNPLWIRYNPKFGVGAVLLAGDHIRQYPLENAIMWMEFGANVGRDRTNGVLCLNAASSTYTDPTIS
jgi:hypothetical protein